MIDHTIANSEIATHRKSIGLSQSGEFVCEGEIFRLKKECQEVEQHDQTPNRFELSGHAEALPAIRWPALRILLMVARQTDYNRSSGGRFSGVFHQRLTDCLPGESADCMITDRSITANSSG